VLLAIQGMASELRQHLEDSHSSFTYLEESLEEFVTALEKVFDVVKNYEQFVEGHSVLRVANRTSLKAEATSNIEQINQAFDIFQVSCSFVVSSSMLII
jgi:hypothetical protein